MDNDSKVEYNECLDIIYKYQDSFEILLCGDLNGTLLSTRSNCHDKLLKNFVNETSLQSAGKYGDLNTFYHHAGSSTSQIDYIVVRNMELALDFEIWKLSFSNVSAHVPVEMMSNIHIANCHLDKNYSNKVQQVIRLIWEK